MKGPAAVKVAPQYDGAVIHVIDASRVVKVVSSVLDEANSAEYVAEVQRDQENTRGLFAERRNRPRVPITVAREQRDAAEPQGVQRRRRVATGTGAGGERVGALLQLGGDQLGARCVRATEPVEQRAAGADVARLHDLGLEELVATLGDGPHPRDRDRHELRTRVGGRRARLDLGRQRRAQQALAARALAAAGYKVLEARDGIEGLEIARRHRGPIHALVTDVVMPRMDGRSLAQELASLHRGVRVLYTSGYTHDAVLRYGVEHAEVSFLSKPYSMGDLRAAVSELTAATDAPRDGD